MFIKNNFEFELYVDLNIILIYSYRHYCDNSSTSEEAMVNTKKCPPGRYCLAGLTKEPDATDCSVGRYCPEGE